LSSVQRIFGGSLETARFGRQISLNGVEIADDDLQQIVDVVRRASSQLSDSFHVLRLAQRFLVSCATAPFVL